MNPTREEALLALALEKLASERVAWLDRECGNDKTLRQRVEKLLQASASLDPDVTVKSSPSTDLPLIEPLTEKAGDHINRYKLLQEIGEGGCGTVYMAEQEQPVRRRVALKVIKLGMDTKQVIARFEAERQALAMMDHPNIAKVLDAGATETGRPFFVMELVRGVPITEYCDQNNLSTQHRLDLFIPVCKAIQHAHQKGIIHRDIKPSNILVTLHDGTPVPKVIDFGIAKAIDQPLTEKTLFTRFEQFMGTPAYMSPEQAEMSGLDIDTRSDIYSLGVLLYELLTGKTPFDSGELAKSGVDAMRKTIREQEPLRPSTKVATLQGEELTTTARRRSTDSSKLMHQLQGDLDWIVMKCLEKDRTRRYETANGLAMDVQRHLSTEPIEARPPSKLYQFQKSVQRNKLAFTAVAMVTLSLAIGLGVSTREFFREKQARQRAVAAEQEQTRLRQQAEADEKMAQTEAVKSRQTAQFLKDMLNGVGPSVARGRDTQMLREVLDQTAERVGRELKDQPLVEAELRNTIGDVYLALGNGEKAEAMQREALALQKKNLGDENRDVATSLYNLARVEHFEWKYAEAESLHREALAIRRKLFGNEHPDVASSLYDLARVLGLEGKLAEAESMQREALAIRQKVLDPQNIRVADSLIELTLILIAEKKFAEAEPVARESLAFREENTPGTWQAFACQTLLGASLLGQKKYGEAEPLLLSGYEGLERLVNKIPAYEAKRYSVDALESLVQLYQATGQPDEATKWKKTLEATTNPRS